MELYRAICCLLLSFLLHSVAGARLKNRRQVSRGQRAGKAAEGRGPAGPAVSSAVYDAWSLQERGICPDLRSFERQTLPNDLPLLVPNLLRAYDQLTDTVKRVTEGRWDARPFSIALYPEQVDYYTRVALSPAIQTVCEVGFNAGYSTAVWLEANPTARVIAWDMQDQSFKPACVQELQAKHPGRLEMYAGNSRVLVPEYIANHTAAGAYHGPKCDLVHIDGDHTYEGARIDFVNLLPMMHCSTLVLMDDMCDEKHCHLFSAPPPQAPEHFEGPTATWAEAKQQQVITELDTFYSWTRNAKGWGVARVQCWDGRLPSFPSTPLFADMTSFQAELRRCSATSECKAQAPVGHSSVATNHRA